MNFQFFFSYFKILFSAKSPFFTAVSQLALPFIYQNCVRVCFQMFQIVIQIILTFIKFWNK